MPQNTYKGHDPYHQMDQAEEDREDLFEGISYAKEALNRIYKPSGKKSAPGKTCAAIKEAYPESKNGEYYIDPNEGGAEDAIKVYCRFDTAETCLTPRRSKFRGQRWTETVSTQGQYFMDEILNGREFDYNVENDQLSFLHLATSSATQTVTYNCRNSSPTGTRLTGNTGEEMQTSLGRHKRVTQIDVKDHCTKHKDNQWHTATIVVNTTRTEMLPIVDMAVVDVGQAHQEFGVEISMACFS